MRERKCPVCGSADLRLWQWAYDGAICGACGVVSTNCEIARGQKWTDEEIRAMGAKLA